MKILNQNPNFSKWYMPIAWLLLFILITILRLSDQCLPIDPVFLIIWGAFLISVPIFYFLFKFLNKWLVFVLVIVFSIIADLIISPLLTQVVPSVLGASPLNPMGFFIGMGAIFLIIPYLLTRLAEKRKIWLILIVGLELLIIISAVLIKMYENYITGGVGIICWT